MFIKKIIFSANIIFLMMCMACGVEKNKESEKINNSEDTIISSKPAEAETDSSTETDFSFIMPVVWKMKVKEITDNGFVGILSDDFDSFSNLKAGDILNVNFSRGTDVDWKTEAGYYNPEIGELVDVSIVFGFSDVELKSGDTVYASELVH